MIPKNKIKDLIGKRVWYVEEGRRCGCPFCIGCRGYEQPIKVKVLDYMSWNGDNPIKIEGPEDYGWIAIKQVFLTKKEALAFIKKNERS